MSETQSDPDLARAWASGVRGEPYGHTEFNNHSWEGWVILELMGHRRLAGHLREQQICGTAFLRLDVPDDAGGIGATQFYAPAAVYCITPTTEETACAVANLAQVAPVRQWELPAPPSAPLGGVEFEDQPF